MNKLTAHARLVGAILVAFLLGGGAIALGVAIPSADGRIFGCYDSKHGDLRVVSETEACEKTEVAIFWNQTGPQGPTGAAGPTGPTGSTGAAGATGPAGAGVASLDSLSGLPCNGVGGVPGTTRVAYADGTVSLSCDVPRAVGPTNAPVFTGIAASGNVVAATFSKPICRAAFFIPTDWTVVVNSQNTPALADSVPVCNAAADNGVSAANLLLVTTAPNGSFVTVNLNATFSSFNADLRDRDGNAARAPQTRTATAAPPERTPPSIIAATAGIGATTVAVTFSEPVYCTAFFIEPSRVTISDDDPANVDLVAVAMSPNDPCGSSQVSAHASFSVNTNGPFLPGRTYTVTLRPQPSEIRDVAGNNLPNPSSRTIDLH